MTTTPGPPAPQGPAAADPAEHRLTDAEACDLDLLLGGVLPSGTQLGAQLGPAPGPGRAPEEGTRPLEVRVRLEAHEQAAARTAGSVLLRDDENTPVALVEDLVVNDPDHPDETAHGTVVLGRVSARRVRASATLAELSVRLPDPELLDRDVLLLTRPPVSADDAGLRAWAASAVPRPLLLVPEGGSGRQLPAVTLLRLAQRLADRLGLVGAEVRVAPLHLREPADDRSRGLLLLQALAPRSSHVLTEAGSDEGTRAWTEAREALDLGAPHGPLPGVDPEVEAVLRSWRPRRHERGLVVLLTGLSGSGKSTLARDLTTHLVRRSARQVTLLDGDAVRRLLSAGLGFDRRSRELNILRIGWVAARLAELGGTAVCSPIAPFAGTRAAVRAMVEPVADLVLVHVSTPLEECERRDLKGLYARARRGEIPDFTGISSPYEVPDDADLRLDTSRLSRAEASDALVRHLVDGGWLAPEAGP